MDWQIMAAIATSAAVIGGFLVWFWRKALPALRKANRFLDRVYGVDADPRTGQSATPGIFGRLDHQDAVLETIRHEVEFNNGTSVKDAVTRVEHKLDDHLAAPQPPATTINVNPTP